MKKKILVTCLMLLPLSVYAEVGLKAGVNHLSFKNSSIETKTDYSIGLYRKKNTGKKFFFSYELIYSKMSAAFKGITVCDKDPSFSGFVDYRDVNLDLEYLEIFFALNRTINIMNFMKLNLYLGPTLALNIKTKSKTVLLKTEEVGQDVSYKKYCQYIYDYESDFYRLANSGLFFNFGVSLTRGIFDVDFRYAITGNKIIGANIKLYEHMSHVIYAFLGIHFN